MRQCISYGYGQALTNILTCISNSQSMEQFGSFIFLSLSIVEAYPVKDQTMLAAAQVPEPVKTIHISHSLGRVIPRCQQVIPSLSIQ